MAIFPQLIFEGTAQVDDGLRLNASKSFITSGTKTIEIDPDGVEGFVVVTSTGYLDWAYDSAGDKTVSVRVGDGTTTVTKTFTITVLSAADDNLFSSDQDLVQYENDILNYLPAGKTSFKNIHRKAQYEILDFIKASGIRDTSGNAFTKEDVVDIEEVRQWSTFLVLANIMQSISNDVEDVFAQKSADYMQKMEKVRERAHLRLDYDGDGTLETGEYKDMRSLNLVMR